MVSALQERMQKSFVEHVSEELLTDCMRCGFCLPACPTYLMTDQDEAHSPRGRISLMKALRDGQVLWDGSIEDSLDVCLGCRACEPACPAGVQYGTLLEEARHAVLDAKRPGIKEKVVRKIVFDGLFADQKKMKRTVELIRFYQATGIQKVARVSGVMKLLPKQMSEMERVLPPIRQKLKPAKPNQTYKVAFFTGCLMDTMFQETNSRTIELLEMAGYEVNIPEDQQCCGALHGHSGEVPKAKKNAEKNILAFNHQDYDFIVQNAGGCGAFLSEYGKLLDTDEARVFSDKIVDISTLLMKAGFDRQLNAVSKEAQAVVTYQDSCHLRNVNGVWEAPRTLIGSAPGFTFIEMPNAAGCCGSAGIYNLLQPEMSGKILAEKMKGVKQVGPSVIVTSNPGCLLQMKVGIEREGLAGQMEAVHIVDFLYESMKTTTKGAR
ncbi:Lactate utilization protein A [Bhargavaea cecembensis DSE10]|uniref:Glycolate oxidase iron-sulfur subunit n=1 Tax=Bhargavaea cecembensis DSE10 TaxID=1235279 RepID=M7P8N3_9BACL|nr:(Fe-S)-binding protein [Bhargavaea cecembensis]EMR06864.1 Lactate utilization protein A [Bhargavaea cecembensis DSE10]